MKVWCVFKEYPMNTMQSQYVLIRVFSSSELADEYINSQPDPNMWCREMHEVG